MSKIAVVGLFLAHCVPSATPAAPSDSGSPDALSRLGSALDPPDAHACGDGVTACVLQCGAAEDWTPTASCAIGSWVCPAPRVPAVQCPLGVYASLGVASGAACGPRVGRPCTTEAGSSPPRCDEASRLWKCAVDAPSTTGTLLTADAAASLPPPRLTDPGCDPGFPKHIHAATIEHVPDKASLDARVTDADGATSQRLRCYARGPHKVFNISEWCCK